VFERLAPGHVGRLHATLTSMGSASTDPFSAGQVLKISHVQLVGDS
jgi:hypothetical protein